MIEVSSQLPIPKMAQAPRSKMLCIHQLGYNFKCSVSIDNDEMATICHIIVTFIALIFPFQNGVRGHYHQ